MTTRWQAEVKGLMYQYGIKNIDVADRLGVTPVHVSRLFTGHYVGKDSEERIRRAVAEIIEERKANDVL